MGISEPAGRRTQAPDEADPVETGLLTIDLGAVAANWRALGAAAGGAECAAVVKADAYGLGLAPVMRALLETGCRTFFVANLREGEAARALASEAAIYVLDGVAPGCAQRLAAARLRPTIGSIEELDEWAATSRALGRKLEAALHFDTGMHRLGFSCRDAALVAERAREISPAVVMSHFVSSQLPQEASNARQIADFLSVRALFPEAAASMCNSSAVFLPEKPHFDLIRPGFALYGGNPTPGQPNPMRIVARLKARILVLRELSPGDSVGYDAIWTAARPSRVATIGAGYADGVPVSATAGPGRPGGEAVVGGVRCPFIGRVSMDYVVLDVTNAPRESAQRGEWVELLGDSIAIDQLAQRAGVIGYEILTRLGRRYARRYL